MRILLLTLALLASPAWAASDVPMTMKNAIQGSMNIRFDTRTDVDNSGGLSAEGSPSLGVTDKYTVNIEILNSVILQGRIERTPWLPTAMLGTTNQEGSYAYDLNIILRNPKDPTQTKAIGAWTGAMTYDGSGVYDLAAAPEGKGRLRLAVGDNKYLFGGAIQGRLPKQSGLMALKESATAKVTKTYFRMVKGQKIGHSVAGADPLSFRNVVLSKGPLGIYSETKVSGSIDYDPEESIWYLEARLNYATPDGAAASDRYSGSIRWVEDPNRKANGKGYYDVNVRLNEAEIAGTEQEAFTAPTSEEDFFAADQTLSGFTGKVSYIDSMPDGESVVGSSVTYSIDANQATKQQTMNFAKILLIMVGSFNDE